MDKDLFTHSEYHELLGRLERANETLSYYKSNKEISFRDLQKLELENSALGEENRFLKSRIINIERNTSNNAKSLDKFDLRNVEITDSVDGLSLAHKIKIPKLNSSGESDSVSAAGNAFHTKKSYSKNSTPCSTKRSLDLKEHAILRLAIAYNF